MFTPEPRTDLRLKRIYNVEYKNQSWLDSDSYEMYGINGNLYQLLSVTHGRGKCLKTTPVTKREYSEQQADGKQKVEHILHESQKASDNKMIA